MGSDSGPGHGVASVQSGDEGRRRESLPIGAGCAGRTTTKGPSPRIPEFIRRVEAAAGNTLDACRSRRPLLVLVDALPAACLLGQAQTVRLRARRCAGERRSERPGRAGHGVRSGRDRVQRGQVTIDAETMVAKSTVTPPADANTGIEGDRCAGNHCGSRPSAGHVHLPVDKDRRGERRRATRRTGRDSAPRAG